MGYLHACIFGSFRITDILSKNARSIDPKVELLRNNVEILDRKVGNKKTKFLRIHLKSPKECRGNKETIKVEVFATGDKYCSVEAFLAYEKGFGVLHRNNSVFRSEVTGDSFTQRNFNAKLSPVRTYYQFFPYLYPYVITFRRYGI